MQAKLTSAGKQCYQPESQDLQATFPLALGPKDFDTVGFRSIEMRRAREGYGQANACLFLEEAITRKGIGYCYLLWRLGRWSWQGQVLQAVFVLGQAFLPKLLGH